MADTRALVLQRHRHLKWKAFDKLEALLMILCGVLHGHASRCTVFFKTS